MDASGNLHGPRTSAVDGQSARKSDVERALESRDPSWGLEDAPVTFRDGRERAGSSPMVNDDKTSVSPRST